MIEHHRRKGETGVPGILANLRNRRGLFYARNLIWLPEVN